jgi:hypothetical protein
LLCEAVPLPRSFGAELFARRRPLEELVGARPHTADLPYYWGSI